MNYALKIELLEKGIDKAKKQLRLYRYPSNNYIMCETRINQMTEALIHCKMMIAEEAGIKKLVNYQLNIWN